MASNRHAAPSVAACCAHPVFERPVSAPSAAAGEGPVGLIVCPSRELARQTFEVINGYIAALGQDGHPELRSLLVMGGVDMKAQVRA